MSRRSMWLVALRALMGMLCAGLLAYTFPFLVHGVVAVFVPPLNFLTFPYLDDLALHMSGRSIEIKGMLQVAMTLQDGTLFPQMPVTLNKSGTEMINAFALSVAVWSAPRASLKVRAAALPISLFFAALVFAAFLSVYIQDTTLSNLGTSVIPSLSVASTEANIEYFAHMESRYTVTEWIKSFFDGGGLLFLSVIAGLSGYAVLSLLQNIGLKVRRVYGRRNKE